MCQKYCAHCGRNFPSYSVEGNNCPNCGQPSIMDRSKNVTKNQNEKNSRIKVDKHTRKRMKK